MTINLTFKDPKALAPHFKACDQQSQDPNAVPYDSKLVQYLACLSTSIHPGRLFDKAYWPGLLLATTEK
jgi:hypothetical protein